MSDMGRRGFFRLAAGALAIASGLGAPKKVLAKAQETFATWDMSKGIIELNTDAVPFDFQVSFFVYQDGDQEPTARGMMKMGKDGEWQEIPTKVV